MGVQRFRLTKGAKVLLVILVIGVLAAGIFAGLKTGIVKNDIQPDENGSVINIAKETSDTINISLDEWIGWKSIIDANGGLSTKDGSIYDKLGIKVNISIMNDATQSSNALISGKLDAAGYTINRTAFLSSKFRDAGLDVIMPFITNFSNGGDGIIAKPDIMSVNDLLGAKVGVPQFSEAHSLVVWFVNQSDLTDADKQKIISNLILFETPDETAKAFFAGKIDVAATWEPYLTQAKNMSDAHILFSTASSSSLIMDGVVFNADFAKNNSDVVTKFIQGALQASRLYDTEMDTIKKVMPMFATASDKDIKDNCISAKLTTYKDNINLFDGIAKKIYIDMCEVWSSIGEKVDADLANTLYDDSYITKLDGMFDDVDTATSSNKPVVTNENKDAVLETEALLQKSATVNFVINTAKFTDAADAISKLDEFIEIAKILDGTIIEVAGNTDPNPATDPQDTANKLLSQQRAETVKQYFVLNGIPADRIIAVGNGSENPVVENDSEEHKAMNRRTDVSFKIIE